MTSFEQHIYNVYLRISRSMQGKPYRSRADFAGFEEDKNYVFVLKLANFFNSHPSVNIEMFFKAPYEIYGRSSAYYLDFYLTPKAHKSYTLYLNQIKNADPDSPEQLKFIIDSAQFISVFCFENHTQANKYLDYSPQTTPLFIQHLLQCKVSIYLLLAFPQFESRLRSFDWELLKFILGEDFFNKLETYRVRYMTSEKARILAQKALEKIFKNPVLCTAPDIN